MSSVNLTGKRVCVVDAYGLIYQVFHATNIDLTNAYGEPTGATFGFVRDIFSIMRKLQPDYLLCAYDMHGATFRSLLYPEYKSTRGSAPDDLLNQFDFTREFLKAITVPVLQSQGFEADDVMATVARITRELGGETILVTSDKDARQLMDDVTSIYLIRKEKYYTREALKEDWGIAPEQVVDFQALVGDTVDNVPGVPLIGPKIASELLNICKTLEDVFQYAQGKKGKRFENLRNFQDQALLSRKLVKLRADAPVEIDWTGAQLGGVDAQRLSALFQYWGFRSLLKSIPALVEEFGAGVAERSEWFEKISAQEGRNGRSPATTTASAPSTLFDLATRLQAQIAEKAHPERVTAGVCDGACDFPEDAPLLERFNASQYGCLPNDRAHAYDPDPDAFELTRVPALTSLDQLELPECDDALYQNRRAIMVDTSEALTQLCEKLRYARVLSVATLCDDAALNGRVRARYARAQGVALAFDALNAYYVPLPFEASALDKTIAALRPYLESATLPKIGSQLKYDALALLNLGVRLRGVALDVSLVDYLAHSGQTQRDLADLASTFLQLELFDIKTVSGSGKKRIPLTHIDQESLLRYAWDLAFIPLALSRPLRETLAQTPCLTRLYNDLERPLLEILAEMEFNGVAIDPECFRRESEAFLQRQQALETAIRAYVAQVDPDPLFAQTINLNSPKQLQRLLFDDLKLRALKKTKSGLSVNAEVLEELAKEHPIPEKIVALRRIVKLRGTYLEPLPKMVLPGTQRVSSTFNQEATATGRLSSSDPNLQNIPARTEDGKAIRAGFIPDATLGYDAFLSCDYSQIELRVLAHFSGDEELKRAFLNDVDIHASVASKIFQTPVEEVTSDMRRKAKAVNFGLVYGQTSFGLSKSLGISPVDAAEYIDAFFATYPGVLDFFDRVLADCQRRGYVQTPLGRRRALTGVRGPRGRQTLNFPERAAINAVVQGAAADLMKLAMLEVWKRLRREGWIASRWNPLEPLPGCGNFSTAPTQTLFDLEQTPLFATIAPKPTPTQSTNERARLLLQIHDELLFETRREDAQELAKLVVDAMTLGNPLSVPLKIDAEIGANWGEL
ncbi:MAG: DNA polymerase I [Planctomycetia bacterium]|nr:DNA polymerase I [Planctomycetia bacterium]